MSKELLFKEKHERLPDGSLSFTVTIVGDIARDNVKQVEEKLENLYKIGGRTFSLVLYEAVWCQTEDNINEIARRFRERGCNVLLLKEKPKWLVQREAELASLQSLPFDKELWEICWRKEEELFDFTTNAWVNLKHDKQLAYTKKYQIWYAKHKEVSLECRDNRTGMDFVLIPGGIFLMGSEDDDREKPIHRVTVKPFLMSKYVVTQAVWHQIMERTWWQDEDYVEEGDDYPAVYISWDSAKQFCKKTGLSLPSEAQWEYACRSGTQTEYYWGDNIDGSCLWYTKNTWDMGEEYAHKVGQKRPNAFGLYDMSGNVWEWCRDKWHENYHRTPGNCVWTKHASRGGGFPFGAGLCRSANRTGHLSYYRASDLGLRIVMRYKRAVRKAKKHRKN